MDIMNDWANRLLGEERAIEAQLKQQDPNADVEVQVLEKTLEITICQGWTSGEEYPCHLPGWVLVKIEFSSEVVGTRCGYPTYDSDVSAHVKLYFRR